MSLRPTFPAESDFCGRLFVGIGGLAAARQVVGGSTCSTLAIGTSVDECSTIESAMVTATISNTSSLLANPDCNASRP